MFHSSVEYFTIQWMVLHKPPRYLAIHNKHHAISSWPHIRQYSTEHWVFLHYLGRTYYHTPKTHTLPDGFPLKMSEERSHYNVVLHKRTVITIERLATYHSRSLRMYGTVRDKKFVISYWRLVFGNGTSKNLCPTLFHTATVKPKRRDHSSLRKIDGTEMLPLGHRLTVRKTVPFGALFCLSFPYKNSAPRVLI